MNPYMGGTSHYNYAHECCSSKNGEVINNNDIMIAEEELKDGLSGFAINNNRMAHDYAEPHFN